MALQQGVSGQSFSLIRENLPQEVGDGANAWRLDHGHVDLRPSGLAPDRGCHDAGEPWVWVACETVEYADADTGLYEGVDVALRFGTRRNVPARDVVQQQT